MKDGAKLLSFSHHPLLLFTLYPSHLLSIYIPYNTSSEAL